MTTSLEQTIDAAWEDRTSLSAATQGAVRDAVEDALPSWTPARCASPRNPLPARGS